MALVGIAGMAQCAAAQDERLNVEVGECVNLPTPEQRLACFEAQVEAARSAPAAAPASPGTAPQAEFGLRERPQRRQEAPPSPEVHAKVAELRERVPNTFLITLDNGQVWRQTYADRYASLSVGQDVRIYLSRWNTYRLDSPQMRGFLQVERVR